LGVRDIRANSETTQEVNLIYDVILLNSRNFAEQKKLLKISKWS